MKKVVFLVVLAVLFAGVPVVSSAQESEKPEGPMMGKMMKGDMRHKFGMMEMMRNNMVATNDGGVVVMLGHKLLKYDEKLNLVSEVEVEKGPKGMPEMHKEGKCPMCGSMMKEGE